MFATSIVCLEGQAACLEGWLKGAGCCCSPHVALTTWHCLSVSCCVQVWLDQADGQVLTEGEEVTLMDWGNVIIKVTPSRALRHFCVEGMLVNHH